MDKEKKIDIYVQARLGSTRLPNKVLMPILGKPMLSYQIERLRRVTEADGVAILTTTNKQDDSIAELCQKEQIDCYRGSENDVLERYHDVAQMRKPDAIVRITGDCPLIDPEVVDLVIRTYREEDGKFDYVANTLTESFPRGLDVEVFSRRALEMAFKKAETEYEREHVTPYLYDHPELFRLKNVACPIPLQHHRWCVDTQEDFALIRQLIEALYPKNPHFTTRDLLQVLRAHPEWSQLNAHVKQKTR